MSLKVIVPTFINPHLFWIIEKKNLTIRNAINRTMSEKKDPKRVAFPLASKFDFYLANVENEWVRVQIDLDIYAINKNLLNPNEYPCWLIDYGLVKIVNNFYEPPEELLQFPKLARQASLYNVVNCILVTKDVGLEIQKIPQKVLQPVPGVAKVSIDIINKAERLFFDVKDECNGIVYGDIIYHYKGGTFSLIEELVHMDNMDIDIKMFSLISYREKCKEMYFKSSRAWARPLDKEGKLKNRSAIIFEKELNVIHFEYFARLGLIDSNKREYDECRSLE